MKIRPLLNKKGQLTGLDTVKGVMLAFLTLAVIFIAVVLALVSLRDSNIFTTGSAEANQTTAIVANISEAGADFFGNTGTIFSILVVVVIMGAIALIIFIVTRFSGSGGSRTL